MRCEICGEQNAVIQIQQINGSEIISLQLCEKCAESRNTPQEDNLVDFSLSRLLNGLVKENSEKNTEVEKKTCVSCGKTLSEFKKDGRLGCFECRKVFKKEISSILKNITGYSHHKGKYPASLLAERVLISTSKKLQEKLNTAVENEDYETAVILRDRIKELTCQRETS